MRVRTAGAHAEAVFRGGRARVELPLRVGAGAPRPRFFARHHAQQVAPHDIKALQVAIRHSSSAAK